MRLRWFIQTVFIPFNLGCVFCEYYKMNQLKIPFVLLLALVMCTLASGGRQDQGSQGRGLSRGHEGGPVGRGARGGQEGFGGSRGRQSNGRQGDNRYRSNLYSDDDVYGYDATYPNGEAAYINYRSKDARARRGPEFRITSKGYSIEGPDGRRTSDYTPQISSGIW